MNFEHQFFREHSAQKLVFSPTPDGRLRATASPTWFDGTRGVLIVARSHPGSDLRHVPDRFSEALARQSHRVVMIAALEHGSVGNGVCAFSELLIATMLPDNGEMCRSVWVTNRLGEGVTSNVATGLGPDLIDSPVELFLGRRGVSVSCDAIGELILSPAPTGRRRSVRRRGELNCIYEQNGDLREARLAWAGRAQQCLPPAPEDAVWKPLSSLAAAEIDPRTASAYRLSDVRLALYWPAEREAPASPGTLLVQMPAHRLS